MGDVDALVMVLILQLSRCCTVHSDICMQCTVDAIELGFAPRGDVPCPIAWSTPFLPNNMELPTGHEAYCTVCRIINYSVQLFVMTKEEANRLGPTESIPASQHQSLSHAGPSV